ncbi:PTS sugar transporter subunit IIA [Anaerostipes sp.]|uniref:PTS sugar transporter subunit IIA n=1 Tax=Anaerostipes sp. TaxID=1872530 RepID=UPI0025C68164|nr:PTS sugar transporter subunit IIA [Anaerostipes sp.]MBS7009599.1 PTS sugar transporter subunit IIA [Anaerostipes sp.]
MIKKVYVIEGDAENQEQALMLTFQKLYKEGCVKETFYEGCVQREKKFPTGLDTLIPVAIPHTDAVHVKSPAVCVLRLRKPVAFSLMEDDSRQTEAEFVFNMALESDGDQLGMLNKIIGTVQNEMLLKTAKTMACDELEALFQEEWMD